MIIFDENKFMTYLKSRHYTPKNIAFTVHIARSLTITNEELLNADDLHHIIEQMLNVRYRSLDAKCSLRHRALRNLQGYLRTEAAQ